jgi:hypothetical protein
VLNKNLHYAIENKDSKLKVGLIGFYATYLTPNITDDNNNLYYKDPKTNNLNRVVTLKGQYSLKSLEGHINNKQPFNTSNIILKENMVAKCLQK